MINDKTKARIFAVVIVIVGVASNSLSNEERIPSPSNLDKINTELEKIKESIATVQMLLEEVKPTNIQTVNVGTDLSDGYLTQIRKTKNNETQKTQQKNGEGS